MFTLFPRSNALRNWPLSLGLLFVAAPLISPSAKAQISSRRSDAPAAPNAPQLTDGARPGSTIAASQQAIVQKLAAPISRSLMMSLPDPALKSKRVVVYAPNSVSNPAPRPFATPRNPNPVTYMAPPAIALSVTIPRRVPALAPPALTPKNVTSPTNAANSNISNASVFEPLAPVTNLNPVPDWSTANTRDKAARLPARGGPILNPSTIQVRPDEAVVSPPPTVSESQRLTLARLDADLAKAQNRLDRAESRLTEGQRQLGDFTNVLQSAMLDAGDDARGLHPFVRVAQRYLGTPYVWGGESARGFDCSGFIMRVMRDLGYHALPHSAAEQFRYGLPIAKTLLKPGDVVFFANTYKPGISHVGIYLGRGRFIHAANSKVGTIVSSLNEPKWIEKYAGARRLLPVNS